MFSYNGEPHGIRKRANQKDYTVRLQQYFDHYLKGAPRPDWMEKGVAYLSREEEKVRIRAEAYGPMQDPKAPVTAQEKAGAEKSAGTAQ
jgi:hypothetical protein